MILAVDIGNSNIVLGCFEENDILFIERLSTNHQYTALEYVISIKNILEINGIEIGAVEGCIISSVVPSVTETVKSALERLTHTKVMTVGPGIKTGLNILMDNPASVGADLIVNAVAGLKCYGAPLIMIDMGTATTVSVLDEKGNYVGGMILPGVRVSLDSLVNRTSQLPKISLEPPRKVIGKNTIDCMKGGIILGQASSMDGLVDRIREDMGLEVPAVATGGLAPKIIPNCKNEIIIDNELTLKGLKYIYDKNVE